MGRRPCWPALRADSKQPEQESFRMDEQERKEHGRSGRAPGAGACSTFETLSRGMHGVRAQSSCKKADCLASSCNWWSRQAAALSSAASESLLLRPGEPSILPLPLLLLLLMHRALWCACAYLGLCTCYLRHPQGIVVSALPRKACPGCCRSFRRLGRCRQRLIRWPGTSSPAVWAALCRGQALCLSAHCCV